MLKFFIVVSLFLEVLPMCQQEVAVEGMEMKHHAGPIEGIRFAGLGGDYYGRVEVFIDGKWGTICDDGWDDADAKVVCRSLGLTGGIAYPRAWFDPGTGNITLTSVNCQGDEQSLYYCTYNDGENCCSHREDAGVMCDDPN